MNKFQLLLLIGAICFFVGLIDDLITHASNFSEFNMLGKICTIGVTACVFGWVLLVVIKIFR